MTRRLILSATLGDARMNDPVWAGAMLAQAETAGLDFVVLGDPVDLRFDPLVLAAWAAPRVSRMGIVAAVPAALSHPFHVARALSAIDFLCDGQSGWMPVPGATPPGLAEDMVAAARSLWDGWDADTLVIDQASGVYLDPAKVRASNHSGPHFTVAGPVNAMRPPQGHPLLVVDGDRAVAVADIDVALVGIAAAPQARLRLANVAPGELAGIAARFEAGTIDGAHCLLGDGEADLCRIAEFAAGLARDPAPGGTLRARLGIAA